jgi:hypothetical protein
VTQPIRPEHNQVTSSNVYTTPPPELSPTTLMVPSSSCNCSHQCFEHLQKAEMYKLDTYYNNYIIAENSYGHPYEPPHWTEHRNFEATLPPIEINSKIDSVETYHDIELPLDLSVNRR